MALPAAQSSPITGISADAPCTATDGGSGQITVTTTIAATCDIHVQLANGDAYVFTVAFQSINSGCCGNLVGDHSASIPERTEVDASASASGLPVVAPGCGATCGTTAGPEPPPADLAAAAAAVEGRWRMCGSWPGKAAPRGVVGIEIDAAMVSQVGPDGGATLESGNAYYLVSGPSGPVRGTGFGYLLTYDIDMWATDSGNRAYLAVHAAPGAGFAGVVRHSPCPLVLEIDVGSPGAVLVPFGS